MKRARVKYTAADAFYDVGAALGGCSIGFALGWYVVDEPFRHRMFVLGASSALLTLVSAGCGAILEMCPRPTIPTRLDP